MMMPTDNKIRTQRAGMCQGSHRPNLAATDCHAVQLIYSHVASTLSYDTCNNNNNYYQYYNYYYNYYYSQAVTDCRAKQLIYSHVAWPLSYDTCNNNNNYYQYYNYYYYYYYYYYYHYYYSQAATDCHAVQLIYSHVAWPLSYDTCNNDNNYY